MPSLTDKTVLISGATRGIGLAIAVRAARDGANVAILGKTTQPHPRLAGTLRTAARSVEDAGGHALPIMCDIRFAEQVDEAIQQTVDRFGGIDVLVNNASAISLTSTQDTEVKRWNLMHDINVRGTFLVTRAATPHLRRANQAHVLTMSPPLDLDPRWFAPHVAYTTSKMAMSMLTVGFAQELRGDGIAVNALWPLTTIDTAAVRNVLGGEDLASSSRRPEIVADAAHAILTSSTYTTGNFFIDEEVLADRGVTDFDSYSVTPGAALTLDFFVPRDTVARSHSRLVASALYE